MPYEIGGRSDKSGNKYEIRWVIKCLLDVLDEKINSVIFEALGQNEDGIDLWIYHKNGIKEAQQCKGRNASKECWDISDLIARNILKSSINQLSRGEEFRYSLISPLSCSMLIDLTDRARSTSESEQEFLNTQINRSGKDFKKFFYDYCEEIKLKPENKEDLIQIIYYLKRTFYKQWSDTMKEYILDRIHMLFLGEPIEIYNALENYIIEGDIWATRLDSVTILEFLEKKDIRLRNLAKDQRILPRIKELNNEFNYYFQAINNELEPRREFEKCIESIEQGKSLIITGKAGCGKSGCVQYIANYCKEKNLPYLAIKLDRRIPEKSAEKYGIDIGLPASIVHCINSLISEKKGIIILDQLDALRWTQSHSRDALQVCFEMIRQIENINKDEIRISIIFVCRQHDLEHDTNIKRLFKDDEGKKKWEIIYIEELEEEYVKGIVGDVYEKLTNKMKLILKNPSNLYIWKKLSINKACIDYLSAYQLIKEWWQQLQINCMNYNIEAFKLSELKNMMISWLERNNKMSIPEVLLNKYDNEIDYLISNGMIIKSNLIISFVHQCIYDYFIVESMLTRFFSGENIEDIIGDKEIQTPIRRYQIEMFLQYMSEYNSNTFIEIGRTMLDSINIRFYIKYVFLEVLSQSNIINNDIRNFLNEYLLRQDYEKYLIDDVIHGHEIFINFLISEGYMEKLWNSNDSKRKVVSLLRSINHSNNDKIFEFLNRNVFKSELDDEYINDCFDSYAIYETNEMFNLRLKLYEKYPEKIIPYMNMKELFKYNPERAIMMMELLLRLKKENNRISIYEEEFINESSDILIAKGEWVIDKLIKYVPLVNEDEIFNSYALNWTQRYFNRANIERACMSILKKAVITIVNNTPERFWIIFDKYLNKGFILMNELILHGLMQFPLKYSNKIIGYIIDNINDNIFDYTSGEEDELKNIKEIIKKYSTHCSKKIFEELEKKLYYFHERNELELYKRRVKNNREEKGYAYWMYWGDVQYHLLPQLSEEKISFKTKELINVLSRRMNKDYGLHKNNQGHSGNISSPISNKLGRICNKQWAKILTNKKITEERSHWKEIEGGFIDNSLSSFSMSFNTAVQADPIRFMNLLLEIREPINKIFINSFFNGLAYGENKNQIPFELIEKIIKKYECNNTSKYAKEICRIIENNTKQEWSKDTLSMLKKIATNHVDPKYGKINVFSEQDKDMKSLEMLVTNSLNCTRGEAASAISKILWYYKKAYNGEIFVIREKIKEFKEIIESLTQDINPAVKMASFDCLYPLFDIEKEWVEERLIRLFKDDYRILGHRNARNLILLLHKKYEKEIKEALIKCYESEDEELCKKASHLITELYIRYGEYSKEINDLGLMNNIQKQGIVEMAIMYIKLEDYADKSKELLIEFILDENKIEHELSRLFYDSILDLEKDAEFILLVLKKKKSGNIIYSFIHYLENSAKNIIQYRDVILKIALNILEQSNSNLEEYWGISDEIFKLITKLYDESIGKADLSDTLQKCLDIWDIMFEKKIGITRVLSKNLLQH